MSRTTRKLRPRLTHEYWDKFDKNNLRDGTQQLNSKSCNNHGGCAYCAGARKWRNEKRKPATEQYDYFDLVYTGEGCEYERI